MIQNIPDNYYSSLGHSVTLSPLSHSIISNQKYGGTSLFGPVAKTPHSQYRKPGLILGQGTIKRCHITQGRVHMKQIRPRRAK